MAVALAFVAMVLLVVELARTGSVLLALGIVAAIIAWVIDGACT